MDQNVDQLEQMIASIGAPAAPPTPAPVVQAEGPAGGPNVADPEVNPNDLHAYVDPEQLNRDLEVNLAQLDEGIRQQASLFAYYAQQAANARRQYERAKLYAEVRESELDAAYREKFLAEGKKVTEGVITAAVKADPRYIAAHERVIDARRLFDIANDSREAFSQRKDMLIQVSVDRRKERDGELRIMGSVSPGTTTEEARKLALQMIVDQARGQAAKGA